MEARKKKWQFLFDERMERATATGGAGQDGDQEQRRGGNEARVSITQL